jgi:hypothetical protein
MVLEEETKGINQSVSLCLSLLHLEEGFGLVTTLVIVVHLLEGAGDCSCFPAIAEDRLDEELDLWAGERDLGSHGRVGVEVRRKQSGLLHQILRNRASLDNPSEGYQ